MRRLATLVIPALLLTASPVQAIPTYRSEVVALFKQVCLPAGTKPGAVAAAAAKLGWKPAPAGLKPIWPDAATKVWRSPTTARFYLAEAPQNGFCQVGYYDGAQTAIADPPAFAQRLREIMIHAGIAVGSGFVKVSEDSQLIQQGAYVSPAYPGLKLHVVVANFPNGPTFALSTGKP